MTGGGKIPKKLIELNREHKKNGTEMHSKFSVKIITLTVSYRCLGYSGGYWYGMVGARGSLVRRPGRW